MRFMLHINEYDDDDDDDDDDDRLSIFQDGGHHSVTT